MIQTSLAVIGAGSWGTALAAHLSKLGHTIRLWVHGPETYQAIKQHRENVIYLPGVLLPKKLMVTDEIDEAIRDVEGIIFSIPSRYFREVLRQYRQILEDHPARWYLSTIKGIEPRRFCRMTQVIREELPFVPEEAILVLSGPSFARELAEQKPTAVVVAGHYDKLVQHVQRVINGGALRVYRQTDVIGVELGGALKNVIALAAGIISGRNLGHNALAALITRGLVEMVRFATRLGAHPQTLFGLAGMGDLVLTCTGPLSRNRTVGYRLGLGESLDAIMSDMPMAVEGIPTAIAVRDWSKELNIEMPIVQAVTAVVHEGKSVEETVRMLLERPLKEEFDSTVFSRDGDHRHPGETHG